MEVSLMEKFAVIALIFMGVVIWAIGTMLEIFNRDAHKLINKFDRCKQVKEQSKKWYSKIFMFKKKGERMPHLTALKILTEDEKWLLFYLQTRAVNYGGKVNKSYLSRDDWSTIEKWSKEGFIKFGSIAENSVCNHAEVNWCFLSEEAWVSAFAICRERFERLYKERLWKTSEEESEVKKNEKRS